MFSQWVLDLQWACNKEGYSNQVVDGYAGPNTLAACPTLQEGSSGLVVDVLQRYGGIATFIKSFDGIFGPETTRAVKLYQYSKNLPQDGIVGKNTWKAMLGPLM